MPKQIGQIYTFLSWDLHGVPSVVLHTHNGKPVRVVALCYDGCYRCRCARCLSTFDAFDDELHEVNDNERS